MLDYCWPPGHWGVDLGRGIKRREATKSEAASCPRRPPGGEEERRGQALYEVWPTSPPNFPSLVAPLPAAGRLAAAGSVCVCVISLYFIWLLLARLGHGSCWFFSAL